jgi:mono/diheme cytochrome c family protein
MNRPGEASVIAAGNEGQEASAEWNRSHYLAAALGRCAECHSPRNLPAAVVAAERFVGGMDAGQRLDRESRRADGRWSVERWPSTSRKPTKLCRREA